MNAIAKARLAEKLEEATCERFETAIECTYIAKALGGNKSLTVRKVYDGMRIEDPTKGPETRMRAHSLEEWDEQVARVAEEKRKQDGGHS